LRNLFATFAVENFKPQGTQRLTAKDARNLSEPLIETDFNDYRDYSLIYVFNHANQTNQIQSTVQTKAGVSNNHSPSNNQTNHSSDRKNKN
jgi:hypothetical protein